MRLHAEMEEKSLAANRELDVSRRTIEDLNQVSYKIKDDCNKLLNQLFDLGSFWAPFQNNCPRTDEWKIICRVEGLLHFEI